MAYPDPPPEDFGMRLKRLAKEKGLSNKALAKATGAHEVTVSRWMAGVVPGTKTLLVLVRLLEPVTLDYLLNGEPRPVKKLPVAHDRPATPRKKQDGRKHA